MPPRLQVCMTVFYSKFFYDMIRKSLGVHEGVVAKLKQRYSIEYIESSPCMAHSFALVGSQAAYTSKARSTCFMCYKFII